MRLHRLRIEAFGPFANPVDVDLDALSNAGLFLIHGPTGSGKTSLLDAVCYALYAAVPGARPGGRALRSHHAHPDAGPVVELEFTAGGRRLRITRRGEYERAKRRGTGTTTVPTSVALEQRVGREWRAVATRADDVGEVVRDVVGMDLRQFATVALLPQGDFAAFLRAAPESRRDVLEKLFDVSRYTDLEAWLAASRRSGEQQLATRRQAMAAQLGRLDEAVDPVGDLVEQDRRWTELAPAELSEQLTQLVPLVQEHAAEALARAEAADAAHLQNEARHRRAHECARLREKASAAVDRLARWDADDAGRREAHDVLEAARRAGAVAGQLEAQQRAVRVATDARSLADEAVAAATAVCTTPAGASSARGDARRWRDLAEKLAVHGAVFTTSRSLVESVAQARALAARAAEEVAACEARRAETTLQADAARLATERLSAQVEACRQAADDLEAAKAAARHSEQQVRAWDDLLAAHSAATASSVARAETHDAATRAQQRAADVRRRRLADLAGELGEGLREGCPCPVCGSHVHPHPAAAPASANADDLAAAERGARRAGERASAALAEEAIALDRLRAATAALGLPIGSIPSPVGREPLAAAAAGDRQRVATAQRAADDLPRRLLDLDEAISALDRTHAALDEATRCATAAALAHRDQQARTEELRRQVDLGLAEHLRRCPCSQGSGGRRGGSRLEAPGQEAPGGSVSDDAVSHDAVSDDTVAHDAVAHDAVGEELPQVEDHHHRALRAASAAADALVAAGVAAEGAARAEAAAQEAVRRHGFATIGDAVAAGLDETAVAKLEEALRRAAADRAAAHAVLDDPDVVAALAEPEPDLAGSAAAVHATEVQRRLAHRHHTLADRAASEVARLVARVVTDLDDLAAAEERQRVVAGLADTLAGLGHDNERRMRLSAFVLAARLEQVVQRANERLARMADGRFHLVHTDELAGSGRRSGLGLRVVDQWTGSARDPATLSGGESFMASLALALGLADAVREQAGGRDLETLFVDEGFGSLDEDSLDHVLGVLDDLRDGGRAVGIVSHVTDLRSRIPTQLRVNKTVVGSTVQLTDAWGEAG